MDRSGPFFLDANVPMYAAGKAHRYKDVCTGILIAVGAGDLEAVTDAEVVQEIAYREQAQHRPGGPTAAEEFLFLMQGSILPITEADMRRCLALMREYPSLLSRDAVHLAVMLNAGIERIITADQDFDKVREVVRIDPHDFRW